MAPKEITRNNITAFVARAVNCAARTAVDAEFGLRVVSAETTTLGNVIIEFEGGVVLVLAGMPVSREIANVN